MSTSDAELYEVHKDGKLLHHYRGTYEYCQGVIKELRRFIKAKLDAGRVRYLTALDDINKP